MRYRICRKRGERQKRQRRGRGSHSRRSTPARTRKRGRRPSGKQRAIIKYIFQVCTNDEEVVYPDQASQTKSLPVETLSEAELALLMHMREEEKLARDVYISLYNKFSNERI